MANMLFANNCNTTLNGGITAIATSMVVTSATGFPAPTGSQYFYCTLADAATQTTIEIVKVTAVSGTTFTIVRGQDGTTGTIFASGAVVSLRLVRASLQDFALLDEANTFSGPSSTFTNAPTFSTALAVGSGGTGLTSFTSGGVPYATSTSALTTNGSLQFNGQVLGVGNTANTWVASYRVLQLGVGTSILGRTDDPGLEIGENEYRDASGNRIYLATQPAAMFHMYAGSPIWYVAPSGTAGNTITFTQAMTLFNSGGLSIGNTTDPGATNLSVTGKVIAKTITQGNQTSDTNQILKTTTSGVFGLSPVSQLCGWQSSGSSNTFTITFSGRPSGLVVVGVANSASGSQSAGGVFLVVATDTVLQVTTISQTGWVVMTTSTSGFQITFTLALSATGYWNATLLGTAVA